MQIVDATGKPFDVPPAVAVATRIVSLVPSLTESLFALGLQRRLAGVTRYCTEPADALEQLPAVGGTKDPDVSAIVRLGPGLVIASSEENRAEDVAALRASGVEVFVTNYPTVRAAIDGLASLCLLLGVSRAPDWLRVARDECDRREKRRAHPVRYFCPIWRRPYMVARPDTYMSDLLRLSGGLNVFAPDQSAAPLRYYSVPLERLEALNPEIILLPDEPYPFAARHRGDLTRHSTVDAVLNGRIELVDGKALTWYGPRTAQALCMFGALFDATRESLRSMVGLRPGVRSEAKWENDES